MRFWTEEELGKRTGFFKILATTSKSQFALMSLEPGQTSGEFCNEHAEPDQWLIVVEGLGEAVSERGSQDIGAGDVILVAAPEKHQFKCIGDTALKFITFYAPAAYPEEN